MSALRTLSARPELRAAAVAVLLVGALALALAAAAPAAAAALAVLAAVGAALVGVSAATRAPAATARRAAPAGEAGPTLRLTLPDGSTVAARAVPVPGESREQLLLTREGYVVVDEAGRVLHRL